MNNRVFLSFVSCLSSPLSWLPVFLCLLDSGWFLLLSSLPGLALVDLVSLLGLVLADAVFPFSFTLFTSLPFSSFVFGIYCLLAVVIMADLTGSHAGLVLKKAALRFAKYLRVRGSLPGGLTGCFSGVFSRLDSVTNSPNGNGAPISLGNSCRPALFLSVWAATADSWFLSSGSVAWYRLVCVTCSRSISSGSDRRARLERA